MGIEESGSCCGSQSAVPLNAVHGGRTMGGSRGGFLQYRWKWPRDKFLQLLSNRRANRPREYCESSVCAPGRRAAPPLPLSIENAARLLHASTLFARFFSKKKNARRPVTNLSSGFIDRFAIILKLGTKKNVLFFFSLFLLESSTKGNMTGKEKRGGSGNKCEIGGGSVGIEASK